MGKPSSAIIDAVAWEARFTMTPDEFDAGMAVLLAEEI